MTVIQFPRRKKISSRLREALHAYWRENPSGRPPRKVYMGPQEYLDLCAYAEHLLGEPFEPEEHLGAKIVRREQPGIEFQRGGLFG